MWLSPRLKYKYYIYVVHVLDKSFLYVDVSDVCAQVSPLLLLLCYEHVPSVLMSEFYPTVRGKFHIVYSFSNLCSPGNKDNKDDGEKTKKRGPKKPVE